MVTLPIIPAVPPPEPLVSDAEWLVSPSQADTFVDCKRKWGFKYIDKIDGAQNRYAALGEKVHKVLEDYLLYGKAPDLYETFEVLDKNGKTIYHYPGRIAYAGMHHLPSPATPKDVELDFRWRGWRGKIDLGYEKDHDTYGRIHVVHDHKTTTNLNYAKTPDDLKIDAQGLIYAMVALDASGAQQVLDQWVYYQTREPYKSLKTELLMTRTMCEDGMVFWDDTAAQIRHAKKTVSRAMDLEPSPQVCDRYGGCPYRDSGHCQLTEEQRVRGYFMSVESIQEKIERMKAQKAAGATGVQVTPGQVPALATPPQVPLPALPQVQAPPALPQAAPGGAQPPPTLPQAVQAPVGHPAGVLAPEVVASMVKGLQPGMFFLSTHPQIVEAAAAKGLGFEAANGAYKVVVLDVVKSREGAINPPEQPMTPVLSPDQQTKAPEASSDGADQFEAMDKHDLEKFIETHKLPVELKKGQKTKTIVKAVRAAWKDRQTALANPGLVEAPKPQAQAQATQPTAVPQIHSVSIPQVPIAPPPVPAPSIPEAVQQHAERQMTIEEQIARVPMPDYAQPTGAYTQAMTEEFSQAQQDAQYPYLRLFIDCSPMGSRVPSVREAFSQVFDALHQAQNVPDYRMVEYGKGPGMLVAGIRHYLETVRVDHGNVFISMSSPEGQLLRDVLVEHADEVYVGSR